MILNKKEAGKDLYEIKFTPKGTKEIKYYYVYAKHGLDASNYLILNKIWGKQHHVQYCSINALNKKEEMGK